MHDEEHLLAAVGLYMRSPVDWRIYQYGTPISMVPAPSGAVVVYGVNVTFKKLEEVVFPSLFELEAIFTFAVGKTP